jgi:hypothetical protein
LEIESGAKRRLADEFDKAQADGVVESPGGARNFIIPAGNNETEPDIFDAPPDSGGFVDALLRRE